MNINTAEDLAKQLGASPEETEQFKEIVGKISKELNGPVNPFQFSHTLEKILIEIGTVSPKVISMVLVHLIISCVSAPNNRPSDLPPMPEHIKGILKKIMEKTARDVKGTDGIGTAFKEPKRITKEELKEQEGKPEGGRAVGKPSIAGSKSLMDIDFNGIFGE